MKTNSTIENIKNRQTIKVIADKPLAISPFDNDLIETLLASAYWAPFHKPCQPQYQENSASIMPWRYYVLSAQSCRNLAQYLVDSNKQMGKIQGMLNSADYLIQATWTPDQAKSEAVIGDVYFEGSITNMEHIAAASASVQNLLLAATSMNIASYWSSGGVLREPFIFDKLGIPANEILLGSIFLFPNDTTDAQRFPSKLRDKRSPLENTYKVIEI